MSSLTPTTSSSPSTTSPSTQTQAKNPISLRLYKVLSTNFDDYATREALGTLSELYGTPDSNDREDESLIGEHAAKARRSLRRDMENKLAESSATFVEALGEVDQKLTELQAHISAMHMACAEAEEQLRSTNDASKTVLERAGTLRDERQSISAKSTIITLFLASFTLSQDETNAITSRDVPVGAAFFAAMDKCEKIREDCRVLMAGEEGPTRAGLDIMQSTSTALEAGYDKILRFLTHEFRRTGKDLSLEVNDTIQEGVKRLKRRPELLSEALSILASTRQNALLTSFLHALTRGGPGGLPRPIELHAHDPIRYVGDMLAWVHQAIAAEREFLGAVFGRGEEGAGRMVGSVRRFSTAEAGEEEEEEWIRELMDIGVGGLVGPLKNRVLQTVKSQESSIVSYKIANLLMFYWVTMRRTVGEESGVTKGLEELTEAAYKVFEASIEAQSRALSRIGLDLDDPALTPPLYILDHAQVLKEVMSVYQSSVLDEEQERLMSLPSDADRAKAGEKKKPGLGSDFGKVLDVAIDPVVESVIKGGEEKGKLRPRWDASVWIVNCLTYILSVLEPFSSFTQEKQDGIKTLLDMRVAALIEEHTTSLLDESGLLGVYQTIEHPPNTSEPLSHFPETSPAAILRALHQFSLFLSSPTVLSSARIAPLASAGMAERVHKRALGRVARVYEEVCAVVRGDAGGRWGERKGGYEAGSVVVGSERPWGRGDLVRQVFGVEEEGSSEEEEDGEDEESEEDEEEDESEEEDGSEEEEGESDDDESEDDTAEDSEGNAKAAPNAPSAKAS
ncbi:hypothetical protein D9611_008423 [Ephemerocybe angulata]|uniref:Conserved oligomeric Golgi complex subunit 6 n=1 Tax=Ephemerocybe angulata TaxID=980116 RepID=A0A8H5F519_9AGAR|nr:hypothetical protein D9611_008423 [Tulosesus angulatus]